MRARARRVYRVGVCSPTGRSSFLSSRVGNLRGDGGGRCPAFGGPPMIGYLLFGTAACSGAQCDGDHGLELSPGWSTSTCPAAQSREFGGAHFVEWQPDGARSVSCEFRPSTALVPVNTDVEFRPDVGGMGTVAWAAEGTVADAGSALSYRCTVELRAGGLQISELTAAPLKATARSWIAGARRSVP